MTSTKKDPVIVVLQLTGGNDYFNTVIPYNDPLYYDNRPTIRYEREDIIPVNDELGFMPTMGPMKELFDEGRVAVIHGIGYADSPRSHFRSMDIWHTCEPDKVGTEGWGRPRGPRDGSQQGKCAHGHQLRTRSAPRPGRSRRPRSRHRRPQHLRPADRHQRHRTALQGPGPVLQDVCPHRGRHLRQRLPALHRHRRHGRRRHCEGGPGAVFQQCGVPQQPHRPAPAGHRPGVSGRPGHQDFLHPARQL